MAEYVLPGQDSSCPVRSKASGVSGHKSAFNADTLTAEQALKAAVQGSCKLVLIMTLPWVVKRFMSSCPSGHWIPLLALRQNFLALALRSIECMFILNRCTPDGVLILADDPADPERRVRMH